ncbi:MAG: sulfotransferase family 2 domain-containing protein [Pseudomonadota bacterium]
MTGFIYIHVPKCGGSSFGAALRMRFFTSQATIRLGQGDLSLTGEAHILSDYAARKRELHAHVARGVRMISGHVQYDADLHLTAAQNYGFLTLLRDPVDRFVSHYNYLQRKHPDEERPDTLDAFLETRAALRLATQYLFYFAGQSQSQTQNTGPLVSRAVRALSRFDLVGDLSDPQACRAALRDITGGPLPLWHRNRAPLRAAIPCALRSRLENLCAPDLEIFESVRHLKAAA